MAVITEAVMLSQLDSYVDVYDTIAAHILGPLAPDDVAADNRHDGEPWYFGGEGGFPAMSCIEVGYVDEPNLHDSVHQPGAIDLMVDFYSPSVGTLAADDGAKVAARETRALHAAFRNKLYPRDPQQRIAGHFNMQGRVNRIVITSRDAGDRDRFGNARAVDDITESILWLDRSFCRVYL